MQLPRFWFYFLILLQNKIEAKKPNYMVVNCDGNSDVFTFGKLITTLKDLVTYHAQQAALLRQPNQYYWSRLFIQRTR